MLGPMLLVKRAMTKRTTDPARVERVSTMPCRNLDRIEASSAARMHHEPEKSVMKACEVTSGPRACIGSMTAMMSAAAPPGAAQNGRESMTQQVLHDRPMYQYSHTAKAQGCYMRCSMPAAASTRQS